VTRSLVAGLLIAVCLAAASSASAAEPARALPAAATQVIAQVRQAAEQRDLPGLRKLMIREFSWSFGGDRDADQAIEAWKEDPKYLRQLVRVLRQPCRVDTARYGSDEGKRRAKCPGAGNLSFRAGFIETPDGWRMEYFVEGD
jgi:hypothetical protein